MNNGDYTMKKYIKFFLIFVIILGAAFSILNFISVNVDAFPGGGEMEGIMIDGDCQYFGDKCPIGIELP